ncbi:MAG: PilN domain-containing protein [Desulfuromonadales bacterium]
MNFRINLATQNYFDYRLFARIGYVLIAALIGLSAWNITRFSWNLGEQRRLETDIVKLEGRLDSKRGGFSEKDAAQQQSKIRFFNEIIARKGTDWLRLLDILESATPEGIAISVLAPGKEQDDLRIEGRARSFSHIRQYLEKLEESKEISEVLLLSHQDIVTGEKGRGVQFALSCRVTIR